MVHEICCVVLCLGLSGVAVGLGAKLPDLRESSPAKIAAGFGGTLNIVVSSFFIMFTVVVAALPSHFLAMTATMTARQGGFFKWLAGAEGIVSSLAVVSVVGLLTAFIPLFVGLRAFRRMEP